MTRWRALPSILAMLVPMGALAQPYHAAAMQGQGEAATPAFVAPNDRRAKDQVDQIYGGTMANDGPASLAPLDQAMPKLPAPALVVEQLSATWARRMTAINEAGNRDGCNSQIREGQRQQPCATIAGTGGTELADRPDREAPRSDTLATLQPMLDLSVDKAATGLANDNTNAEDRTNQALAAVAFGNANQPPPGQEKKELPADDPANSEAVQAVLGILGAPKP
jgi:hypothetical protein